MPGALLDRRLVVVTGKGGTGKSAVTAALGLLAARRGRRAVVAEVGRRGDVPAMLDPSLGATPGEAAEDPDDGFHERALEVPGPGELHHVSVSPEAALHEYLRDQLPFGALAELLRSSRVFTALTAATPGMRELLAMGKVWELAQDRRRTPGARPYDLCVMDAPATGHATTILAAPTQFADTARVGPVARQGRLIARTIADPAQTAVVLVSTAEELAVSEAIEAEAAITATVGLPVTLCVVNGLLADRFRGEDREVLEASVLPDPALGAARSHARRARDQQAQVARLRRELEAPVTRLPFLAAPRLGPPELGILADRLAVALRRVSLGPGDVRAVAPNGADPREGGGA